MNQRLADRLKALGHPARLEILRVLAARGTCVCGEVVEVILLGEVGFEHVRVAEAKPIALPDEALAPHMDAEELAVFRASGIVRKSVTVLGSKPTAN